ncbi:hypothetical protein [Catenovulum sediminis]|uniref:hypothetical protein n=1 Tax=Catenovulum sediminis TaxID=1740262 RepID=UPI00117FD7F5|nr:hypothetical protein [Catenovulum sediminis]
MKHQNFHILLIGLVLMGCQATGPTSQNTYTSKSTAKNLNDCTSESYNNLPGPEFSYTGEARYVNHYFNVVPDSSNYKYGKDYYTPLIESKFKFTGDLAPNEFKYHNPYIKVLEVDGVAVQFKSNVNSLVVTESCKPFWFSGHVNYNNTLGRGAQIFKKTDGSRVDLNDFQFIYGKSNVTPYEATAVVDIDKFSKRATIKTKYTDGLMLRAWSDSELSKKPDQIQVYKEISLKDWSYFDRAISDDGQARKLVKIDTDVRDCDGTFGCWVYETIGVTVPLDYVKNNKDGFEIQVYGKQKSIIKVPKYQISAMLKFLESIK